MLGDSLSASAVFNDSEFEAYWGLPQQFENLYISPGGGNNHLLGHSQNIQGDMQLEAQLVTRGLNCGDPSGWEDPRSEALESGADDWILLLQLDSDETADLMWGDGEMLYYWIRRDDLEEFQFDHVWMTLQCS